MRALTPAEIAETFGVSLEKAKEIKQKVDSPKNTDESQDSQAALSTQQFIPETTISPVNDTNKAVIDDKSLAISLPPTSATPNVDMERFLLSSMLLKDGAVVPAVADILDAEDFYRPEHKVIFKNIVNLYSKLSRVDILFLIEQMKQSGEIKKIGTESVFSLTEWANTTAYSEFYARILKEKANNRRINRTLNQIFENTRAGLKSSAEIVADATAALEKITADSEKNTHLTNGNDYFENFFSADVDANKKYAERKTGFSNIDEHQIFSAGLYVLGAISANGKTTFAWQLLNQLAGNGETCLYCSYEMSRLELFSKSVIAALHRLNPFSSLTSAEIRRGAWTSDLNSVIADLKVSAANVNVLELSDETVDDLLKLLKPLCKRAKKPPVVVVDYLQIIPSSKDNLKLGIDDTVRKLKVFQRETGTTFIVISSFNRSNYVAPVSFESFKESGNIEYSADVIWGLQLNVMNNGAIKDGTGIVKARELISEALKENPRAMHLRCLKNRQGQNYDCYFKYYSAHDFFEPATADDFEEIVGPPEPDNKPKRPVRIY